MVNIVINGDNKKLEKEISLFDLLQNLKLDTKKVAIELNREIIPKSLYKNTDIKDKDILEIVHFIGGG